MTANESSLLDIFLTDPMYYIYWGAAIIASAIFVIQTLSLFVGFDTDNDFSGGDASFDVDGLHLVSVKTVACFVLGFGWTGVILYRIITEPFMLAAIALGMGVVFMLLIAVLLREVLRLSQDNTFYIDRTVGRIGEVYLRIPAQGEQKGKITVSVDGSVHELLAINRSNQDITTGSKVRILEAIDSDTVIVEMA